MIVIDASVAAKWLIPEAGSAEAAAFQEDPRQLVAPDLIRLEVASAITKRVRSERNPITEKDATLRCQRWFHLLDKAIISLVPERDVLARAIELSVHIKHALPDCLYLAVATSLDAELITADENLVKRACRHYNKISLLPGCSSN